MNKDDYDDDNNNHNFAPCGKDQVVTRGLAEVLRAYFARRLQSQVAQLDKEHTQCEVTTKAIKQTQMQWRQRAITGASFHLIDLRQLAIENDNLTQSLESKTAELAKLKNISTFLVQELNGLLDSVNELQTAQSNMKKEFASRKEYLAKGLSEMKLVTKESTLAQHRNEQIKLQHEQLKVPKMEEYMAQKAELFELNKALGNWQRKVEIASGQAKVQGALLKTLNSQKQAAHEYTEKKKQDRIRLLATQPLRNRTHYKTNSCQGNRTNNNLLPTLHANRMTHSATTPPTNMQPAVISMSELTR